MGRHRQGKTYTRHGRIEGLDKLLKRIERWPEVQAVNPGKIHNVRSGGRGRPLTIRVQMISKGHVKCVAQRTGRKQELDITTQSPERVAERIRAESWGC